MYACTCGLTFPGTLAGAWQAKVHADEAGHEVGTGAAPRGRSPPVSAAVAA